MKTKLLFFAMLISVAASAQNMQITTISATYTTSPVITFKVEWTGARGYRHNTKVWVFVDYRKVENNAPAGNWMRAAITATPAVNSTPASTASLVPGNNKGFWLHGMDGDYSATLTVPLELTADVTQFNWCAYVTDYPPNAVVQGNNSYTLRGSQPFVINGTTLPVSQTTYSGTITSFTDATGAPGLFPATLDEKPNGMGCVAGLLENVNGLCVTPAAVGCSPDTLILGAASFTAGSEVVITGNGISQIWSRPVTAEGCQKQTYENLTRNDLKADCRDNPGYNGDMFSGCAAMMYAATLCPPPWRLPTMSDYRDLLLVFNYTLAADVETRRNIIESKIVGEWGGEYAGVCIHGDLSYWSGVAGNYYANYAAGKCNISNQGSYQCVGRLLYQNSEPHAQLNTWVAASLLSYATDGLALRCIRD